MFRDKEWLIEIKHCRHLAENFKTEPFASAEVAALQFCHRKQLGVGKHTLKVATKDSYGDLCAKCGSRSLCFNPFYCMECNSRDYTGDYQWKEIEIECHEEMRPVKLYALAEGEVK